MNKIKLEKSLRTDYLCNDFTVHTQLFSWEDGSTFEKSILNQYGKALVIPIISNGEAEPEYLMLEKHSTILNSSNLEFPKTNVLIYPPENNIRSMINFLTGADPLDIKFIYKLYENPHLINSDTLVFIAVIKNDIDLNKEFKDCALTKLTAEELHTLVLNNEIVDSVSLAALTTTLFRNKKITQYLDKD